MQDFEKKYRELRPFYSYEFDFLNREAVNPGEVFSLFLKRLIRIIVDLTKKPFAELTILDLACFEGLFATELARLGASVVGIEGRNINIQKAEFLKEFRSNPSVRFIQDDVRNISKEKYGKFDIIIAAGILYHLEAPDHFKLIENIYSMCREFAIIDTHVSLARDASYRYKEFEYWGRDFAEFENCPAVEDRETLAVQSSLDNKKSFWPTKISLFNLLAHCGFTTVLECSFPSVDAYRGGYDRITVVAIKGGSMGHLLSATLVSLQEPVLEEVIDNRIIIHPNNVPKDFLPPDSPREIILRRTED